MSDIAMCRDMECPMKFKCYRHTAPWNQFRQSVFAESPRKEGTFYCDQYWDNEGRTLDPKFREYENYNDNE
jgi:hypothetical protein